MEDQYSMADLRQLMNGGRSHFPPSISQHIETFPGYRNLPPQSGQLHHHHLHQYELMMTPGSQASDMITEFRSDSLMGCAQVGGAATATATSAATFSSGFEVQAASYGGDGGSGRWPRQETLTLLEIRSRLDSKFKETNQKGPLWDEISRIMSEEYGYQRSGKKCREKFDNLYKYYKKTKEGKAGRQDGKHYRFFRQLEALYGETNNGVSVSETNLVGDNRLRFRGRTAQANPESTYQFQKHSESLGLSNSLEFYSSSSDGAYDVGVAGIMENEGWEKRREGKCWKAKVKKFINSQMRKLVEKQEEWLDKLMKSLEQKEKERMIKEEEWRKNEVSRIEREHRFWARERAWIEARDSAFMEVFQKFTGGEPIRSSSIGENQKEDLFEIMNNNGGLKRDDPWREIEAKRLIQLSGIEAGFWQGREDKLWEEIRSKMASLGYERSSFSCREKWESIKEYVKKEINNKKRKDNSINFDYLRSESFGCDQGGTTYREIKEDAIEKATRAETNEGSSPNHNANANVVQDNCFRFLLGEGESMWENYGMKYNKEDKNGSTS